MLKTLRDNIKHLHWVLWLVIVAFVAIEFGVFGSLGPEDPNAAAATVGDESVTFSEFERQYRTLEDQYRQMFGEQWSSEMAEQLGIARQALEQLINRQVLLIEARRLGLSVTDEELRREVMGIPAFQQDGRFIGADRYEMLLRSSGYTPASFEDAMRRDLLIQKIGQVLSQNLFLTEDEVREAYRRQVERARIRFVQMPQARFAEEARATQAELQTYLAENLDDFQLPEQREVAYLLVDRNMLAGEVEVPEEELRAYYDDNAADYSREEQVQARHILLRTGERSAEEARRELEAARERIEGGEDFAAVAQEVSEDPGSAQRGGDLGFFGRGQMVPEFEEAAFAGAQGELLGPVESPFGLHLIQVTGRREAGQQPFEEVREQIRFQLAQDRLAELARVRAAELAQQARDAEGGPTAATLSALAEDRPAVFFYEPDPFGRDQPVAGIGRSPDFTEVAFTLPEGSLSDPVELPRGWAVILAEGSLPPRSPELAEVEPEVRRAVETAKRKELARQRLAEARNELAAGRSLDEVAGELELTVQESQDFQAGGQVSGLGFAPEVTRAALDMDEGEIGGPFETPQGAVLFEVTGRTTFDPVEFEGAKAQARRQLLAERANQLQGALIQQRRQELGVNYSRRVVEQFNLDGSQTGGATG